MTSSNFTYTNAHLYIYSVLYAATTTRRKKAHRHNTRVGLKNARTAAGIEQNSACLTAIKKKKRWKNRVILKPRESRRQRSAPRTKRSAKSRHHHYALMNVPLTSQNAPPPRASARPTLSSRSCIPRAVYMCDALSTGSRAGLECCGERHAKFRVTLQQRHIYNINARVNKVASDFTARPSGSLVTRSFKTIIT